MAATITAAFARSIYTVTAIIGLIIGLIVGAIAGNAITGGLLGVLAGFFIGLAACAYWLRSKPNRLNN